MAQAIFEKSISGGYSESHPVPIAYLQDQLRDIKSDLEYLRDRIDKLLEMCNHTNTEVRVLSEVKNMLKEKVDSLSAKSESLADDKTERKGVIKGLKYLKPVYVAIFFAGYVLSQAQIPVPSNSTAASPVAQQLKSEILK